MVHKDFVQLYFTLTIWSPAVYIHSALPFAGTYSDRNKVFYCFTGRSNYFIF